MYVVDQKPQLHTLAHIVPYTYICPHSGKDTHTMFAVLFLHMCLHAVKHQNVWKGNFYATYMYAVN